ncbi:hypothetical protein GLOIN_2v1777358 [Rhizophagus irregularis DAOM 181602=DAOM 197198]|uniref:Integrase catalytic domain-containing protein n=1 Tax=Rhizophagus irregularis (strain DAOM 181602 / DAOM 197198 / MUCL 43194) TaxID=747089 RepID=A0A2P4PV65_RHIID|nr:hypothetical protein GLOIN_2v1777358 [Rhizophagus irregularis DAOM 181602=DAOM 197198]POG69266.1 hypothetical protein GLOIN_2v1777358 [Rhizophagus irregularis DAOM 181602=DAOM 197198]|eukprot:XP_025176132.1 hypothetical protein GLOIN_2v1777358 [Rhizophagus irregularis DAOM 181602=DAOM 197198]
MSQPQIVINPDETLHIVCRLLFYNIPGFYTNAKTLYNACQKEGYSFRLRDIAKWLVYQYIHQIYRQPLPCKAEASFSKIKIPNKVQQCDILLHTKDDQDGRRIFVCTFLIIDVATRFKDASSITSRNSLEIWNAVKEIFEDPSNNLTWQTLLMTDGDASFRGAFFRGMQQYNVPIRVVDLYSLESLALIKAFKKRIAELIYKVQYAIEGRLTDGEQSRLWKKILKKYIDYLNNSKTRFIGMSPARAMTLEEVESKPSRKAKRAIGKDEEIKLQKGTAVRYLLKPGELEGDHRRRATDPYWSLRVYKIKRVVIGKNPPQPILYYLENGLIESTAHLMGRNPKRPFKFEELQVIEEPDKIEYPPDEFMRKYHPTGFVHYVQVANNKLTKADQYAKKCGGHCLEKTGRINGHNVYLWSCENGAHQWEYPLKPSFLNGMQLDGYNEELKLAFEYHGSQHYNLNSMFHKRGQIDLDEQKSRDQKKRDICKQEVDEVKPSKKYQGDPHALAWPFRIIVAGASNSGERNVKCDDVILCGHHLNEPKYRIVRNFYKYLAQDKSKPYYEDITFSTLTPDKIPDPKKFNVKRSKLTIFEDVCSDPPAIQKKIIPYFSRGRHENISSIYVSQKFHRIPTDIHADQHKASKVIDGYLRQKEFVVIDINKPRSESFSLRWDTPLNLEKEIKSLGNTSN